MGKKIKILIFSCNRTGERKILIKLINYAKLMSRRQIIMPSSYKRRIDTKPLPAIERYDGVLHRVLKRNLKSKY